MKDDASRPGQREKFHVKGVVVTVRNVLLRDAEMGKTKFAEGYDEYLPSGVRLVWLATSVAQEPAATKEDRLEWVFSTKTEKFYRVPFSAIATVYASAMPETYVIGRGT